MPVILMTAHGSPNIAIQASSLGVYGYITKPFEMDEVLSQIQHYFERQMLREEVRTLRSQIEPRDPSERIIGNSPAMHEIYMIVGRSAQTEATVLITGETGSGKELVAQVLHSNSTYRHGPLVKVNCAALPETLSQAVSRRAASAPARSWSRSARTLPSGAARCRRCSTRSS